MPLLPGPPEARIGRGASEAEILLLPVLSVLLGSLTPILPLIAEAPLMQPFGFLILIGWRLLRREIWPAWVGVPFGLFDDLLSGQPMGSAILLWTCALLVIEMLDRRMIWRDFRQDWVIAGLLTLTLFLIESWIANPEGVREPWLLLPHLLIAILSFPMVMRFCAALDRIRSRR